MKRFTAGLVSAALLAAVAGAAAVAQPAQQRAPQIPFTSDPDFLKLPPGVNFGEVLGIAVNSNGEIVVLNHPGTAHAGPLYGNATTELWKFAPDGAYVGEIGRGVYGFGYGHSVRFDRYDNLWMVDKGTNSVMKFNPEGRVTLNLGRRPEGYDTYAGEYHRPKQAEAKPVDGYFNGPTDIGWDMQDNIYIGDGYVNSRVAKIDKNGDWVTSWGSHGLGGARADENAGQINNPHNLQVDRQGRVYIADRGNRRIQVFDSNGKFLRFIFLNVPYDKKRRPALGSLPADPNTRPDETAPWVLCISPTPTQYLYAADPEPGRIYKISLDGKILGWLGESGRQVGQFNWAHGIACPTENTLYIADMNNWRVQKLTLGPVTGGR
jgi:opacity protein-like surface antigen